MDSLEFIAIFVAIASFFFIHTWWSNRNNPIINWPFFGMLPTLLYNLSNIHDYATTLLKQYGGTFMFKGQWLTNSNFLITIDPLNVHHITTKNFDNYIKGPHYYEIFEIMGDGIFNIDSHKWKKNKNMLLSLFRQNSFENLVVKVIHKNLKSCLVPLLNDVSELETVVDLQDIFERFTFDNICSIVLGFDPKSLPNKLIEFPDVLFENAFNRMEDSMFYRHVVPRCLWKLQKWLQIGQEKTYSECGKTIDQFLYQCISSTFQEQKKFNCTKDDDESNFNMLKALAEESGMEQIDQKFLRDNALNLLAAGRDSVSPSLSWFFWLVSTHPTVESKILEEITANFITKEENWLGSSRVENLNKLVYLHGAICEALRLFPPLPFEHKSAVESDILPSGDRVNANTTILYSLYSMGRMEQIWGEDCLDFKPERWISEKGSNIHIPSHKFIVFNAGPRSCLGKNIGLIQMKIIAIALLQNFQFEVVEGHNVRPCLSVILHMKHGLKVNVTKRGIIN